MDCGPHALLVEDPEGADALDLYRSLLRARPVGVYDLVAGAHAVLVRFDPARVERKALTELLAQFRVEADNEPRPLVEVPVVYDGPDLAAVAAAAGLTEREVAERHAAGTYTVSFVGRAPGLATMTGLDQALHVDRRAERAAIPAGSITINRGYTSAYPAALASRAHVIGRTDLVLWEPAATDPMALPLGASVRFVEVSP